MPIQKISWTFSDKSTVFHFRQCRKVSQPERAPHVKGRPRRAMWGPHTMSQNVQSGFWGEHWTSEGVKPFFFFFGFYPMFGGKLDVGRREDLFLRGKRGPRKMFLGRGHALPSFGPDYRPA